MKVKRIYKDSRNKRDKIKRAVWQAVRLLFFATLPGPLFKHWRIFVLRCFGAKIGRGCRVDSSCTVWWPGNLVMGNFSCLASGVDCYNVGVVTIGDYATVSQRAFLCSASHATDTLARPLVVSPITIERHAWVCAEAFVGPGVTISEGSVLGARSVATKDVAAWTIRAGNPSRYIRLRHIKEATL